MKRMRYVRGPIYAMGMLVLLTGAGPACIQFNHSRSGGGGGGGGSAALSLNVELPEPAGATFAADDPAPRTLSFSHNGDSVECSRDNGVSWGPCDGPDYLVYTPAEYSGGTIFKVRVHRSG